MAARSDERCFSPGGIIFRDGPVTTYKAGQSFSERPGDRHGVSANGSKKKPAKLLAVFVVDTNETELTIPIGN
jgi:quercetin dioxygenase-like cupin family protein